MMKRKFFFSLLCFAIATVCYLVTTANDLFYSNRRSTTAAVVVPLSEEEYDLSSKKMVAFGSSRTWGANIPNRHRDSYSALLGARNLGIRASGPEYPALCTYSMLSSSSENNTEEYYDVIVLEYSLTYFETAARALPILARRLRQRYPDAIIIFLSMWMPKQYRHIPTRSSLDTWIRKNCGNYTEFLDCLQEQSTSSDWKFVNDFGGTTALKMIAKSVDGSVISLDEPPADAIESLKQYSYLYTLDMTHFSEQGHVWVKDQIMDLLSNNNNNNNKNKIPQQPKKEVQPWRYKDHCTSWFESGSSSSSSIIRNTTMPLREFREGKFALEAEKSKTNILEIYNYPSTWDDTTDHKYKKKYYDVYVSFMTHTDPIKYPKKVEISLHQEGLGTLSSRTLNPRMTNAPYGIQLHIVSHRHLGKISTNTTTDTELSIRIQPDVDDVSSENNFRIVGIMITPYHLGDDIKADIE